MASVGQLREAAELQLSELEVIQSMYPGMKEVIIDNNCSVMERRALCDGSEDTDVLSRLDYTINITVNKMLVSLSISLPSLYPFVPCEAVVRCTTLNKEVLAQLNTQLTREVSRQQCGELCVGVLLAWLTDNDTLHAAEYLGEGATICDSQNAGDKVTAGACSDTLTFSRLWIYSHHIYNKNKRRHILALADERCLTGFVLPGKPGLVCVEGTDVDTAQWWTEVRSWNWKRIACTKNETVPLSQAVTLNSLRRFHNFHELGTEDNIRIKGGGYHVDMGDLYRYLKKHNSEYMFKEYFGVEGRE